MGASSGRHPIGHNEIGSPSYLKGGKSALGGPEMQLVPTVRGEFSSSYMRIESLSSGVGSELERLKLCND